jgi:hypothetical protein
MEEETGINDVHVGTEETKERDEIFTRVVRAGKRTYFFDVKATRKDEYYLTITESKKRAAKEGKIYYEKHKIFLYKEDFDKFTEGLKDAVTYIVAENGSHDASAKFESVREVKAEEPVSNIEFTNIEFDDLGKK